MKCVQSVSDNYSQLITNLCDISNTYFFNGEFDSAFQVLDHGERLSELRDVPARERAKLWVLYGKIEEMHSALTDYDYQFAIALLRRAERAALDAAEENLLAWAYDELGQAYLHRTEHTGVGNLASAKKYFTKGFTIRDKENDIQGKCMSMIHLAQVAECQNNFTEALNLFQSVKEMSEKHNYSLELSFALRHLAKALVRENKKDEAFPLFQQSLDLREEIGMKPFLPFSYISMGQMYDFQKNRKKARDYYQRAFDIAEEMKAVSASVEALIALGESHVSFQDFLQASTVYTEALEYANNVNLTTKSALCKQRLIQLQN